MSDIAAASLGDRRTLINHGDPNWVNVIKDHPVERVYVASLLFLLPTLLNVCRHFCAKIQTEMDYLDSGFTFQLKVAGLDHSCICRKTEQGTFERISENRIATDVVPGSGQASADSEAITIDYVITFRSIGYAFDCFIGNMSLTEALAQRAFSTHGPNDAGVALTYMFIALLTMFFCWRKAYRS